MYVTVAEKGRLGAFVGVGVSLGVTSDSNVAEGSNVNVGSRVCVSVTIGGSVGVQVASSLMGVMVGVGEALAALGG